MAVTLVGTIRTAAGELAEGTVTITSEGASAVGDEFVVGDTSGPVTLVAGAFEVEWIPQTIEDGQPATVLVEFDLTNAPSPDPITVPIVNSSEPVNVLTLPRASAAPAEPDVETYLTRSAADRAYLAESRIGQPAEVGDAPTGDGGGGVSLRYGVAPVGEDGLVPVEYVLDLAQGFGPGTAVGYSTDEGRLVPVLVDTHYKGYVTSPPNQEGEVGDFFRNAAITAEGGFVREWVCTGGTTWLPVVVNRAEADAPTPAVPAGALVESFALDGPGWGPGLPWTFLTGAGSRTGGRGYMEGTALTIARMDTALASPNHQAKLTWVSTPDAQNRSVGVCTRMDPTATSFYVFEVTPALSRFTFQKWVDGEGTNLSGGFRPLGAALAYPLDIALRSRAGGVHECYVNGTLIATYSDVDTALNDNVHVGAWQYNGNNALPVDDFEASVLP